MDGGASNGHTYMYGNGLDHETDNVTNMLCLQTRESLERAHDTTGIGTAWPWVSIGLCLPANRIYKSVTAECGPNKEQAALR